MPLRSAAVVLLLAAFALARGETEPRLIASVSRTAVPIGDTLTYELQVAAPESARVVFETPGGTIGGFEVLRRTEDLIAEGRDGGRRWTVRYVLAAFDTGHMELPPVGALVIYPDGARRSLAGDTLTVAVESVLGEGQPSLRDIKGLVAAPGPGVSPVLVAAIVAAAAVLMAAAVLLRRRRRRAGAEAAPQRAEPPEVLALARLEALMHKRLLETGRHKDFYYELTDILRAYLEGRFGVSAQEMTTAELELELTRTAVPGSLRAEIHSILEESDLVKFAKFRPPMEAGVKAAERVREVVRATAPARMEAIAS